MPEWDTLLQTRVALLGNTQQRAQTLHREPDQRRMNTQTWASGFKQDKTSLANTAFNVLRNNPKLIIIKKSEDTTLVKNIYLNVYEMHLFHAKYTTNTFSYLCT